MIVNLLKSTVVFFLYINKSIYWFLFQIRFENFVNYMKDLKFDNKKIAILGNGPSLRIDLVKIKNCEIDFFCVVNNFALSNLFVELKPNFYIIVDPAYFFDDITSKEDRMVWEILEKVNWEMVLYIPFRYYKNFVNKYDGIISNINIKIIPIHIQEYNGFRWLKYYLYKRNLSMPKSQNVIIPAIFNSINQNFLEVYVLGVDHSWTKDLMVDNYNRVCIINDHFYENNGSNCTPFNTIYGNQYRMHEVLRDFANMFDGYNQLGTYATLKGCKIYNVTNNSFIDSFERF